MGEQERCFLRGDFFVQGWNFLDVGKGLFSPFSNIFSHYLPIPPYYPRIIQLCDDKDVWGELVGVNNCFRGKRDFFQDGHLLPAQA